MSFVRILPVRRLTSQLTASVRQTTRVGPLSVRFDQTCLQLNPVGIGCALARRRCFHTFGRVLAGVGSGVNVNEAIVVDESRAGEGPWLSEMRKRGLYSEDRYRHYHQYKVDNFSISEDKRTLDIVWNDGHTSSFDALWLRHQCHCPDCKLDTNGMGRIQWEDLPLDITVLSAELEGDRMMVFRWGKADDGHAIHQGVVPVATLRCYCYSDTKIRERRGQRAMRFHQQKDIPSMEYEEMRASDKGLHKCLTAVNDIGMCLVKNVPTDLNTLMETIELIGPIQSTMYGNTYEVESTPNAINAAYTSHKLSPHMDLVYYETPPGLQILHCTRFDKSTEGGNNTFLDIHEMAHKFRKEQPEFFDRLCRYPVIYSHIHYNRKIPVHMENQKPIFALNHYGEIVSVAWHPMVKGPVELPKEDMMKFYEAYIAFYKLLSTNESLYKFRFEVGDFVVFNNRRVLHAREAFSGGGRRLQGGYVELSDFHSRIQALHNKYGGGRVASRSGSTSWL